MTRTQKQILPALHNSRKLSDPDLSDIGERNYTSTILKYGNLALPFPQLNTNAKTIVDAINELYAHPGGSVVIPNPELGGELQTESGELILTESGLSVMTEQGGGGGTIVGELNSISIDGDIYTIPSGGGGGDGKHRTLTQAEYDALPESEKNNGTIYFITDEPAVVLRPEDLRSTNAHIGQLLSYTQYDMWEPTVDVGALNTGDILSWQNNTWKGKHLDMGDVATVNNPQSGQAIVYDSQNNIWKNGTVSSVSALGDLTDVTITSAITNQILKYNGSRWVNADESTGTTVSVTPIQTTGTKIATISVDSVDADLYAPNGGAGTLDDLTDVNITSVTGGQVLAYDSATSKWINSSGISVTTFTQVVSHGAVSTNSAYATVTFPSIANNKFVLIKGYDTVDNVDYSDYIFFDISTIGSSKSFDLTLHKAVTFQITPTSISTTYYKGSYYYIYADVYVCDTLTGISELVDLTDVSVTSPTNGQVLKYDNGEWVNAAESGGSTVSVTQIQSTGTKIATISVDSVDTDLYAPNGGAVALDDLTDVTISSVSDGQIITWDSISNKWINTTLGDGTSAFTKTQLYNNTGTLQSVIQLNQSIQNFDLIEIVTNYPYSDSNVYCQNAIYTSAELVNSIGQTNPVNWHIGNDSVYTWIIVTDVDEFTVHTVTSGLTLGVRQVYGYKFNGGGSGTLTAEELTTVQYEALSTSDKLDPDVLHFVNDNISTTLDVDDFYLKKESSMNLTVDSVNNTIIFDWLGGGSIGANAIYTNAIPSTVSKISFEITTGSAYSTSNDRFKIGIGVKSTYSTSNWDNPTDNDWLALDVYAVTDSTYQGELDLSSITTDSYLYICGHGWDMTVNSVILETYSAEPKLLYKDYDYTGSGGSGASALEDLSDVSISAATSGQVLKYDGSDWVNGDVSVWTNVVFNCTTTRQNNPSSVSLVVQVSGSQVFSKSYTTSSVYGVFAETTDTFTYNGDTYTIKAQGFQASSSGQKMMTVSIDDVSYDVLCPTSNSSYASTVSFILIVSSAFPLNSISDVNISSPANGQLLVYNATSGNWENRTPWVDITGTLLATQTSVTLSSVSITTSSTIDVYVDDSFYGVNPTAVTLATGSITLTFEAQESDMPVKVRVS